MSTCSHPHNLPYNDECAVWWLRGMPEWAAAHTNLDDARTDARLARLPERIHTVEAAKAAEQQD